MDLIDHIINQARDYLVCPICGSHYLTDEIRLRGFIDNTYIFQALCAKSHEPLAVTYLASLHRLEKPIGTYFHSLSGEKLTKDEEKQAEEFFNRFDGDFSKI